MRVAAYAFVFAVLLCVSSVGADTRAPLANPEIDMEGFLRVSREAAQHRATRRLTEEEFMRLASEPGTVVLDARSRERYDDTSTTLSAARLSRPTISISRVASARCT